MPASHHKYEVKQGAIVWGREEAIQNRESTLIARVLALDGWMDGVTCPSMYLEKVLKVAGSKGLHLRCIVCKPADGFLPKGSDESEPGNSQCLEISPDWQCAGLALPSVKLIDRLGGPGCEDADDVGKKGLPHSKLKLMQQVNRE